MAWVEEKHNKSGTKYVGRYRDPAGRKRKSPPMDTKKAALQWAQDQETAIRNKSWIDPDRARRTFRDWVYEWWELYDFKVTTESGYYSILHKHLLPRWGNTPLEAIDPIAVERWMRELRATVQPNGRPYSEHHIQGIWRLFYTILEDAVYYQQLTANPVRKRRRRAGQADHRPEKREVHTSPIGALLFAERAAVLSGRDDEFLAATTLAYTGMRWGELLGLKRPYIWLEHRSVYVEVELVEVNGRFHETPPKSPTSKREIHLPEFLLDLLATWVGRDNRTHLYLTATGAHPSNSHCSDRYWRPAADGWYPERKNRHGNTIGGRPVLVDASSGFPGTPHTPAWPAAEKGEGFVEPRGRGLRRFPIAGAAASWLPIRVTLTPHDLRRSMRTWLQDAGVPSNAAEARMGHAVPGIDAAYNVVSDHQRQMILDALEARWWAALALRYQMCPTSPVPLLQAWLEMAASRIASGDIQWGACPPFAPGSGLGDPAEERKRVPELAKNPWTPGSCRLSRCRKRRPLRPADE